MTRGAVAGSLDALVGRRSLGPDEVRGSRQLGKLKSSSPSTMSITMGEREDEDMRSETSRPEEQDTRAAVPDEPNAAGVIEGCSGGEKRKMAGLGWIVLAAGAETDGVPNAVTGELGRVRASVEHGSHPCSNTYPQPRQDFGPGRSTTVLGVGECLVGRHASGRAVKR
eukprot:scaffold10478_cov114-Isochrysis_galbana.AAC.9